MTADPAPTVHLCIIQPAGYMHSLGLLDAALYFRHELRQIGAEVTIAKNRLRHDAPNLVFGAHLGFDPALARTFCCIFVNLEQLGAGGSQMPPAYLDLLRMSRVIDYDAGNPRAYDQRAEDVPLISFGYAPFVGPVKSALPLDKRPFDLLFFGSMNARRSQLIERIERTGRTVVTFDAPVYGPERDAFIVQARAVLNCHHYDSALFEQVRAFQVLSLGTPLVSERTERTHPGDAYQASVSWFTIDSLEEFFTNDYPTPDFASRAASQLKEFQNFNPLHEYVHVLEFARAAFATDRSISQPPPNPQRLLHIGSGKDYRPGWLNVDILDSAQPDIRIDLSQPQVWPSTFISPFWGEVCLQAGASDLIYANNVLEHVTELAAMMRNCLDLLRVGGLMVIEVPYEESLGAWQDPTHVRAMNENSWLYYTDWFWYLGWFEHRFKIYQFRWLDAKLAQCEKSAAAFMSVTLEKVPTTVAERMTARTMRPDFGGLLDPVPLLCATTSLATSDLTRSQRSRFVSAEHAPSPYFHAPRTNAVAAIAPDGGRSEQHGLQGDRRSQGRLSIPTGNGSQMTRSIEAGDAASGQSNAMQARHRSEPTVNAYYDGINEKLFAHLPEARSILEFGCAYGRLGEEYKKKFKGAKWIGIDINEEALAVAAKRLDVVLKSDLDDDLPFVFEDKFDLIVFGDVIEHVKNPKRLLSQINKLCHENSRIVCCIPNMSHYSVIERLLIGDIAYDNAGLLDETHVRFFSPSSMTKLFLDAGWLPKMVDSYSVASSSPALQHLIRAAQDLGCPPSTSLRNFSLYQLIFECRPACNKVVTTNSGPKFSVVVAVTNPLQLELNVKKSPGLMEVGCELILVTNAPNASAAFSEGSSKAKSDWILYCHQDVYFPKSSGFLLNQLVDRLEASANPDPLIGFAGVSLESPTGLRYAGLCNDRLNLFDFPASVSGVSIDECAVMMRRNSQYRIDANLGWHLWATDLCLQSIFGTNQSAEIVRIPIFHNSFNDGALPEAFHESARILKSKYPQQRKIPTIAAGVIS